MNVHTAAAAAKSLQSYLTLCDPIDGSPSSCPVPGFSGREHWSGLPFEEVTIQALGRQNSNIKKGKVCEQSYKA